MHLVLSLDIDWTAVGAVATAFGAFATAGTILAAVLVYRLQARQVSATEIGNLLSKIRTAYSVFINNAELNAKYALDTVYADNEVKHTIFLLKNTLSIDEIRDVLNILLTTADLEKSMDDLPNIVKRLYYHMRTPLATLIYDKPESLIDINTTDLVSNLTGKLPMLRKLITDGYDRIRTTYYDSLGVNGILAATIFAASYINENRHEAQELLGSFRGDSAESIEYKLLQEMAFGYAQLVKIKTHKELYDKETILELGQTLSIALNAIIELYIQLTPRKLAEQMHYERKHAREYAANFDSPYLLETIVVGSTLLTETLIRRRRRWRLRRRTSGDNLRDGVRAMVESLGKLPARESAKSRLERLVG